MSISTQMLYSNLAFYLKYTLYISESNIALIDGFVEFISYIVRIFSGVISDYLHERKLLLIIGCGLSCIIKPFFGVIASAKAALFLEILERIGSGIQACPRDALLSDIANGKKLSSIFGLFKSIKTAGAIIGAIISSIILSYFGYNILFSVAAIPALFAIIVLIKLKTIKNSDQKITDNPFQRKYIRSLDKTFWTIVCIAAICECGHMTESLILIRASEIIPIQTAGITAAIIGAGQMFFSYPLGKLADKYGNMRVLKICILLIISSYFSMLFFKQQYIFLLCIFILSGQQASLQNIFLSLISKNVSQKLRATAIGILYSVIGLSYFISSNICGYLYENKGYLLTMLACIFFYFTGLLFATQHRSS